MVAKKDGYVYVFTSNESQQDVLFDNLSVYQSTGPILEETHYYPFGLVMDGISTVAPLRLENNYKYNGKELNHHEFSDGSGLEWYSYGFREYDPQIGRFIQHDPLSGGFAPLSPYQYAANDPIANIDYMGLSVLPNVLPTLNVVAKGVHRMSAFSRVTSKILGAASLAGKIGSVASLAVHGAQIAGGVINGLETTKAVGEQLVMPPFEYNVNKKTGEITKVSNKGGGVTNYYNLGTENAKGVFQTEATLVIKLPNKGNNSLVSEEGKRFIKSYEKLSLKTYDADPPNGDWTIGWGHKILAGEDFSGGLTFVQSNNLFRSDLWRKSVLPIFKNVNVPLFQWQFDALASYVFNVGIGNAFDHTELINQLISGHYFKTSLEMDIVTAGGEYRKGLYLRRQAEQNIYNNAIYDATH